MKKIILTLAIIAFMVGTISISYGQEPDKRSEKAREKLQKAQNDSIALVYQKLKTESEVKFKNNNENIAVSKARIANEKNKIKTKDENKLTELQQKNTYLKKKLDDYKIDGKEKWDIFKAGFSQDMDDLSKALTDLTVKSVN
jgi:hypothetical protein